MLLGIIFIILIVILISFGLHFIIEDAERPNKRHLFAQFVFTILFMIVYNNIITDTIRKRTFEDSLNGHTPYKKEYIYKQIDSTYVIMDSVYVKKEKETETK